MSILRQLHNLVYLEDTDCELIVRRGELDGSVVFAWRGRGFNEPYERWKYSTALVTNALEQTTIGPDFCLEEALGDMEEKLREKL